MSVNILIICSIVLVNCSIGIYKYQNIFIFIISINRFPRYSIFIVYTFNQLSFMQSILKFGLLMHVNIYTSMKQLLNIKKLNLRNCLLTNTHCCIYVFMLTSYISVLVD